MISEIRSDRDTCSPLLFPPHVTCNRRVIATLLVLCLTYGNSSVLSYFSAYGNQGQLPTTLCLLPTSFPLLPITRNLSLLMLSGPIGPVIRGDPVNTSSWASSRQHPASASAPGGGPDLGSGSGSTMDRADDDRTCTILPQTCLTVDVDFLTMSHRLSLHVIKSLLSDRPPQGSPAWQASDHPP